MCHTEQVVMMALGRVSMEHQSVYQVNILIIKTLSSACFKLFNVLCVLLKSIFRTPSSTILRDARACTLVQSNVMVGGHPPDRNQFRFHRAAFYSQLKSKVGNILVKTTDLQAYVSTLRYPLPPLHLACARLRHPPL